MEKPGVNLRTLRQYGLKNKDINKRSVQTVLALANVLDCRAEYSAEPDGYENNLT